MFQYRAALVRLRQGDTDREIARSRLMGRPKTAALRAARRAHSTISSLEPYLEQPRGGEMLRNLPAAERQRVEAAER